VKRRRRRIRTAISFASLADFFDRAKREFAVNDVEHVGFDLTVGQAMPGHAAEVVLTAAYRSSFDRVFLFRTYRSTVYKLQVLSEPF
jgi:hypothetical protein